MILKLIVIYNIFKLCKKISTFFFGKRMNCKKYFVMDFITMTPIMLISSLETLLNFGDDNTK